MEKPLIKATSLKVERSWISKKAKELSNITTFSSTVEEKAKRIFNKITGKPRLSYLFREYNLPGGLFPKNIICYGFDEGKGKLVVYLQSACEATFKNSSVLRYATRVKGVLAKGKLTRIEGMITKVLVWTKVTAVAVEGYKSDKVCFMVGVQKSRPKDAYDTPRDAVKVPDH